MIRHPLDFSNRRGFLHTTKDELSDPVHEARARYCHAILIACEMLYRR
jgi:hypothetical protein